MRAAGVPLRRRGEAARGSERRGVECPLRVRARARALSVWVVSWSSVGFRLLVVPRYPVLLVLLLRGQLNRGGRLEIRLLFLPEPVEQHKKHKKHKSAWPASKAA